MLSLFLNILLDISVVSSLWISSSQIRSKMNGKCLDILDGINEAGTNIQMNECNGENAQNWVYDVSSLEIKNANPIGIEYCLDLEGGDTNDGTNIRIWHCNGQDAQKWQLNTDETISNINGGCLDIWEHNNDNFANVALYTCHATSNQRWFGSFIPSLVIL